MKSASLRRVLREAGILTLILGIFMPSVRAEAPKLPPFAINNGAAVNMLEVKYKEACTPFIIPQDTYFIWAAKKDETAGFQNWKWERYGPYSLIKKLGYQVHIGQVG
jgi:hypothetical protein